jgi:hypothetical protein
MSPSIDVASTCSSIAIGSYHARFARRLVAGLKDESVGREAALVGNFSILHGVLVPALELSGFGAG